MPDNEADYRYWQCSHCNRVVKIQINYGLRDIEGAAVFPVQAGERRRCILVGCHNCRLDRMHIPLLHVPSEEIAKKIQKFGCDVRFKYR